MEAKSSSRQVPLLAALVGLVLVAFAIRVYHLDFQSFWRDEVDAAIFASESLGSLLAKFTVIGENGPLYFFVLHYWVALAGDAEFSLRFFSVAFGVATVPLTYAAGALIAGRWTGAVAAVVATLSPYYVWYAQEAKMYSLLAALTLLSVYFFVKALEHDRPLLWVTFVVATSLSLYVHFFAALIVVAEGAIFLAGIRRYRAALRGFALSAAVLTLPYLPLAAWQLLMLLNPPPSPYEFLPLRAVGTTLLAAFSVGVGGGANALALSLFVFLLLCAAILGRGEAASADRWPIAVLLLYLLVPLGVFYVVSLRYPLFTERYLIVILPAFQLLAGAGLVAIGRRSVLLVVACASLVAIFSGAAIYAFQHTPAKADFRAAVRYYEARARAGDAIMAVMPYMRRSFDYYHRGSYWWVDPPYTNQDVPESAVRQELEAAMGGVRRVWLFLAEEDFWDNRGLARGWLDTNGRLLDDKEFVGVRLRYYELP